MLLLFARLFLFAKLSTENCVKRVELPGMILLAGSAVTLVSATWFSWSMPVVDSFGFRQAQTALTAEWMARGYPFFNYITPVAGAPWSIPFELPLFQWLSAQLSNFTGMGTDRSGRLVSIVFYIGSVWMLFCTVMAVRSNRVLALCIAGAFAISPLSIFWARSVMIESTAVFFGLVFVWAIVRVWRGSGSVHGLVAVLAATLAALVKVTTFYGFAVFVAVAFLWIALRENGWQPAWIYRHTKLIAWGGASAMVSLIVLMLWLNHADAIKAQTPFGSVLTTASLSPWNYGTLAQRLDPAVWWGVFVEKRFADLFGSVTIFVVIVLIGMSVRATRAMVSLLFSAYLVPFFTFTNLHFVHDYYQAANQVFATSIVGLVLWWIIQAVGGRRGLLVGSLAALGLCGLSGWHMSNHYLPMMKAAFQPSRVSEVAKVVGAQTEPDDVLIVFGMDWSSELAYFGRRRAVMTPDWAPVAHFESLDSSNSTLLGGAAVGAVVDCPNGIPASTTQYARYRKILDRYSVSSRVLVVADCRVLLPRR